MLDFLFIRTSFQPPAGFSLIPFRVLTGRVVLIEWHKARSIQARAKAGGGLHTAAITTPGHGGGGDDSLPGELLCRTRTRPLQSRISANVNKGGIFNHMMVALRSPDQDLNAPVVQLNSSRTHSCLCRYAKATLGPYGYHLSIATFLHAKNI